METGELAVATHLVQMATDAEPENREVHEIRKEVYAARRAVATSLMAKGIYKSAINASIEALGD